MAMLRADMTRPVLLSLSLSLDPWPHITSQHIVRAAKTCDTSMWIFLGGRSQWVRGRRMWRAVAAEDWTGPAGSIGELAAAREAADLLLRLKTHTIAWKVFEVLLMRPCRWDPGVTGKLWVRFKRQWHNLHFSNLLVLPPSLGELSKQIFGKSWEFGPTGLTHPPPPCIGERKIS